jgi:murein DD-endopeptidase MepM/ murein hydrolase activator NlpD
VAGHFKTDPLERELVEVDQTGPKSGPRHFRAEMPADSSGRHFREAPHLGKEIGSHFKEETPTASEPVVTAPESKRHIDVAAGPSALLLEKALAGKIDEVRQAGAMTSLAARPSSANTPHRPQAKANESDIFDQLLDAFNEIDLDAALKGFDKTPPRRHDKGNSQRERRYVPRSSVPTPAATPKRPTQRPLKRPASHGVRHDRNFAQRSIHHDKRTTRPAAPSRPRDSQLRKQNVANWFEQPLLQRVSPWRHVVERKAEAIQQSVNAVVAVAVLGLTVAGMAPSESAVSTEFAAGVERSADEGPSRSSAVSTPVATMLTKASGSGETPKADKASLSQEAEPEPEPAPEPESRFGNPAPGAKTTSVFGMRIHPITGSRTNHEGLDYAASSGSTILAAADGTVTKAGWEAGYGLYTCIDHGDGLSSCYGHQSKINVSVGQTVSRGENIGLVGSTGRSTGPHLHFEARLNGNAVNPTQYL